MRIDVNQEDIDNGKRHECSRCPVALAIRRCVAKHVAVTGTIAWIGEMKIRVLLPFEACQFVRLFDNGEPIAPFSFDLDLQPEPA